MQLTFKYLNSRHVAKNKQIIVLKLQLQDNYMNNIIKISDYVEDDVGM